MAIYTVDLLTGGTPSADSFASPGYEADKACDDNAGTYWNSAATDWPHWWKYDLGAGITKIIAQLTISGYATGGNLLIKNFTLLGSPDNVDFKLIYTGLMANSTGVQTFTFTNFTGYRYYKVNGTDNYSGAAPNNMAVYEFQMMSTPMGGFFLFM